MLTTKDSSEDDRERWRSNYERGMRRRRKRRVEEEEKEKSQVELLLKETTTNLKRYCLPNRAKNSRWESHTRYPLHDDWENIKAAHASCYNYLWWHAVVQEVHNTDSVQPP